ncbi:MAG: MATE family efflux transporter, partial [Treponema sp.]|nr:MATE family efflux transporter [Treponema sp.]
MTESKNIPASSGENKMGTMPVTKLILNMSLPMMFSMLIQALYNIVDSIFVARLGEDALTAVSLAFPIQNLMISLAVGTGVGINSLLSLRLGQKNQEDVDRTAMNGLFLAFCNTIAFIFVGVFAVEPYLRSQTTNEAIIQYGIDYLQIVTILGFGVFFEITFSRLLQSTGRTIYTMISQLVGAITNIIFDPLLIFGIGFFPELGMKGAAYATVLGQIFGMIVGLVCNIKRNPDINFKLKNI